MTKIVLLSACAVSILASASHALAQDADSGEPTPVAEIVIPGEITFRNRVEGAAPVLSYDTEYFQRFEPLTAGDAMKRVPSVQFLSDVLESDGARLRGLDPGYTQILIDGEKVPGSGLDRSFFVDRIPAELIDRIEVVRSSSANRSGDAVAGALNIVLRDAFAVDGGYIRGGALYFDDSKVRGTLGGVWSGAVGPGRLILGANIQGRHNPKAKLSYRYDEPGGTLDNIEVQSDVRDGKDISANASYQMKTDNTEFELSALYVKTDRLEDEDSLEYQDGNIADVDLITLNDNNLDIEQDNWAIRSKLITEMLGGKTRLKIGYAAFKETTFEFEDETEYLRDAIPFPEDDRFTHDTIDGEIEDSEVSASADHRREFGPAELEFGLQYNGKDRDYYNLFQRARDNIPNAPAPRPTLPGAVDAGDTVLAESRIEERRVDPYVMLSGKSDVFSWETGLRYETTKTDIDGIDNDYNELLPSASARFRLSDVDRLSVSVARTVRRPDFDDITPGTLEEEIGEDDFLGNPLLKPETAWGLDVGVERRLGRRGVVGINAFYRDVKDLIELTVVGLPGTGSAGGTARILSPTNVGDGKVWGVEFDLSTPLTFVGLPNTGVFLNYSWLDSEVDDVFGERRFNDQAKDIFNVGFIHDIPSYGAAFGATYRKQGVAFGRTIGEEVTTRYGEDLEVFVEKRIGERIVVRLTGSNLLDLSKDEAFDKFATQADQIARDYDEYEIETEKSGPVFQLVTRLSF